RIRVEYRRIAEGDRQRAEVRLRLVDIDAVVAVDQVVAALAVDRVVARSAGDAVARLAAPDRVVARATVDRHAVLVVVGVDDVVAGEVEGNAVDRWRAGRASVVEAVLRRVAVDDERRGRTTAAVDDDVVARGRRGVAAAF